MLKDLRQRAPDWLKRCHISCPTTTENSVEFFTYIRTSLVVFILAVSRLHIALLYVHRCFFAHAISSSPNDPIKSQYAPSFLAGYRSACDLVGGIKAQFSLFPAQIARFWVLWTHAFSSSVRDQPLLIDSSSDLVYFS
jgi:hypothetical protein